MPTVRTNPVPDVYNPRFGPCREAIEGCDSAGMLWPTLAELARSSFSPLELPWMFHRAHSFRFVSIVAFRFVLFLSFRFVSLCLHAPRVRVPLLFMHHE